MYGCGLGLFGIKSLDSQVDLAFPDENSSGTGSAQETYLDGIAVLLRFQAVVWDGCRFGGVVGVM
jgi:hypothetical protein